MNYFKFEIGEFVKFQGGLEEKIKRYGEEGLTIKN